MFNGGQSIINSRGDLVILYNNADFGINADAVNQLCQNHLPLLLGKRKVLWFSSQMYSYGGQHIQ